MNNKVKDIYDKLSKSYENSDNPFNSEYERPAMMNVIPQNVKDKMILDAGCTAGWYTNQLINKGANVVAVDISPEMVAATNRKVGEKAKVLCINLEEKLPFEDNTFDIIISSLVLHYIKEWNFTFSEFHRVLKKNGKLIFSVHHPFMDFKLSQNKNYFDTEYITDKWEREGQMIEVSFFRRPLNEIVNTTSKYFTINRVIEPLPTEKFKTLNIEKYTYLMSNPHFLIIDAFNNKNIDTSMKVLKQTDARAKDQGC